MTGRDKQPTCAGERGSAAATPSAAAEALRRDLEGAPTFVADAFFLTQKAVWVGLLPALYRCVGCGVGRCGYSCSWPCVEMCDRCLSKNKVSLMINLILVRIPRTYPFIIQVTMLFLCAGIGP